MLINLFFSGMSCGSIYVHDFPLVDSTVVLRIHNDCVLDIQLSTNQKYFASCDVTGFVLIWYTNTFTVFIKCMESSEVLIAWHPWKEDDLMVGKKHSNLVIPLSLDYYCKITF